MIHFKNQEYTALKKRVSYCMHLSRAFDLKAQKLIRQNLGGVFHLSSLGHEMLGAVFGVIFHDPLHKALAYYRDRSFVIAKGARLQDLFAALLARKSQKHCSSRQMPEHFCDPDIGLFCQSSVVGTQLLQACGVALSMKLKNVDTKCYVSIGEGGTSQGDFHEALNFSCLHQLPIVFVVQDNGWAISVSSAEQTASSSIDTIAKGYSGLDVLSVDGTNMDALIEVACKSRDRKGPCLVVAKVARICAHSSSDDQTKYRSALELEQESKRDPFKQIEQDAFFDEFQQKAKDDVERAFKEAQELVYCNKDDDLAIFLKGQTFKEVNRSEGEIKVMVDALNDALTEEMNNDDSILVFGQDVADPKGGVFGVTSGLTQAFSKKRCFNSPLAESTILGTATGLALSGFRPVVEIQFADYLWTGINHLFNEISSMFFRSNGLNHLPMVIRMPCGGYIQGGPYHSQSIEGFLSHCPGLKVVMPSNSRDAKGLLKAAIRDPNPVVFLEHKALYRQQGFSQKNVGDENYLIPLGLAKTIRQGSRLTIISYAYMTYLVEQALNDASIEDVEHIDLRTIVPIDKESIFDSVTKTGKVLLVQEAPQTCGFAAEVAALIAQECFESLDAPVSRLCAKDCPVAYSRELEEEILPSKARIISEIQKMLAY